MDEYPKLHHEDLDAYKASIEFVALAMATMDRFPRGYAALADQLRRAAFSIPLNIAEGYGKRTIDDRSRFYDIARGSAHECGAIWDVARIATIIDDAAFVRGKALLVRIVSMLVKMVAVPQGR